MGVGVGGDGVDVGGWGGVVDLDDAGWGQVEGPDFEAEFSGEEGEGRECLL